VKIAAFFEGIATLFQRKRGDLQQK